ncbi:MAG: hypothetical protein MJ188_06700 [Treponema sp.]|nr:hypothetical protein [Treponema sp.]
MVLYMIGIIGGDILICIFNLIFNRPIYGYSIWYGIIASVLAAVGVIAIDGICATIVRRCLPEKWFDYTVDFHDPSKKECRFYEKLGIKKWKDYVLELGMFTNFSKKSVQNPNDVAYIERFILENNYGVWCHNTGAVLGFLLILFYPSYLKWSMALPACIINFILSSLPTMILRYNTNRLRRTRAVLVKKQARQNHE